MVLKLLQSVPHNIMYASDHGPEATTEQCLRRYCSVHGSETTANKQEHTVSLSTIVIQHNIEEKES